VLQAQIVTRTLADADQSAQLIARVGIQPRLSPRDLRQGLSPAGIRALDEQLSTRQVSRDLARIKIVGLGPRDHLDFEIRARQRNTARIDVDQEVREHWQGLPTFDDTDDLLQTPKEGFPLNAESHVALILSLLVFCLSEAIVVVISVVDYRKLTQYRL